MASPLVVGTTSVVVAPINTSRASLQIQNTSATQTIYIKKIPISGSFTVVSATDYEMLLTPATATAAAGDAFVTNSVASFMAIASAAGGAVAIYETNKVS